MQKLKASYHFVFRSQFDECVKYSKGFFQSTDVTSWTSLCALFSAAATKFGSIDIVCANAGIPEKSGFLLDDELDSDGKLKEPSFKLIDVNVNGVARSMLYSHCLSRFGTQTSLLIFPSATKLALHYFKKNKIPGGSLVITGSAAS